MNKIDYETETITETVIVEKEDEEGNIIKEETEEDFTTLYITISHKTTEEIARELQFSHSQNEQLSSLLDSSNQPLWAAILYGTYSGDLSIVEVAESQVGNIGGEPYWSWYGYPSRVE